jgi:PKD-like family
MNMKKQLLQIGFILFITTIFFACKKDLGNYNYTDVNVITITTDMATANPMVVINNDSVIVKQNDSLKLDILITQTIPVSDLSYQWLITQADASLSNPAQYIVGTEKQLRTKIILPPNLYRLVVRVTDNKTGVSFYKFYSLNVDTSPWGGEGWLVLQDQSSQGGCDISIITSRDAVLPGTVYSNLYFAANSKKLPVGTYKTAVMNYLNTLRIQRVSFMYPNGALQVRSVDYLDSSDHTTWFWALPSMINVQENGVFPATGQWEYLINNSQFHLQQVNTATIKTPPLKYSAPLLGSWSDLSSSVILGNADGVFTLFDKTNRCFFTVWLNSGTMTLVPTSRADVPNLHYNPYSGAGGTTNLTATGKGFDMNNIGRNLIYSDNVSPMSGTITYDCIFRNTIGDSTFMYQIPGAFSGANGGYANNFTSGRFFLSESKVPGINTASIFAMPTFLTISAPTYGVFYYVHGTNRNSIYVCNPSYTGTLPATTTSHLGYSFPAGTIIKTMKVFKSGYTTAPSTESKVLVVATDETASGAGHKVYFFNLTGTGEINNTPANVYTGFDKIVDIAFKKGLGF